MNVNKKNVTMFLFVIVLILVIAICFVAFIQTEKVVMLEKYSWFDDFFIKDNKVFFRCNIMIENTYDCEISFVIKAESNKDVENKLLKSKELTSITKYVIPPNAKEEIDVVFQGEWGGGKIKDSRNLPDNIQIEIVPEV